MAEQVEVTLDSLVGEHLFSGSDCEGPDCAANVIRFVLDGRIYMAVEDENDGYRSALGTLAVVDDPPVTNSFEPIRVVVRMATWSGDDYIEVIDVANGKTVLEVGTDEADDYYPSFIATFYTDRMAVNAWKVSL